MINANLKLEKKNNVDGNHMIYNPATVGGGGLPWPDITGLDLTKSIRFDSKVDERIRSSTFGMTAATSSFANMTTAATRHGEPGSDNNNNNMAMRTMREEHYASKIGKGDIYI